MISDMVKNSGLDLEKSKMIGVSLGAHVAGVAGAALGGKIDQIIVLSYSICLGLRSLVNILIVSFM